MHLQLEFTNLIIYLFFNSNKLSDDSRFIIEILADIFQNQTELLLAGEIDELTELHNRKAFERTCASLFSNSSALGKSLPPTCFAMLDIDYFKAVNDEYGHLYGDEVLLLFAQLMKKSFRTSDQLFRYGGEEFSVIMNNCDPVQAHKVLERFRVMAEAHHYPQVGNKTVSIGYTILVNENGAPLTIDQADQALYFSKENGRNQITYYDDLATLKKIKPKESQETIFF